MSSKKVSIAHAFKTIIWPKRNLVFIGLILIAINRPASLVLPWLSKPILGEVNSSGDLNTLLYLLAIGLAGLSVQAITSFLLTKILSVQAQYFVSVLRAKVQKKILSLPISYFDNNKAGALVSRVMTDVEGVRNLIGTGLVQMIGGVLTSVICLVVLIKLNGMMTLYVLAPVSVFGVIAIKAFGYLRPIFKKRTEINADVTGRLTETLNGVRVIKGFNSEEQENVIFEKGVDRLFQNIRKSLTATAIITSASGFLLGLASIGIFGIGGYLIIENQMKTEELVQFILFLGFMIAPIVQMGNIGSQLTEAFAGLDRTEEILNMTSEDDDEKRTRTIEGIKGNMVFENVSFAYEEGTNVLKNVSFKADPGSVTALVGTSGSGKSTIAGLVATFLNPSEGKVSMDGVDLSTVHLSSYRQHLGVVLQDDFLFEGTIRENILFPRPDSSEEQLQNAVKSAYVNEFTDRFEEGLETVIGERGVKLSGGQRQRIAIARAVLADPKIIILDEATSNLDTESEALIQESLKDLMKGRTTFVIAHRLSTIRQANQILVIEDGQIAERGTHDELIEKEGRYHKLFTYQSRI